MNYADWKLKTDYSEPGRLMPMHQVIEFYLQNLQLARDTGERRGEMSALASLGRAYDALEERDKAVELYELALRIARDLGDSRAERQTLKHLNETLHPQSQKESPKAKSPKKSGNRPKRPRKAAGKKSKRGNSASGASRKSSKKQPSSEQ